MARGAELPVVARCGHLAENILIGVAHSVAVVHIEVVNAFNNLGKGTGALYEESGILHETTISRLFALVQCLNENESIPAHNTEHRFGFLILEDAPTQIVIGYVPICIGIVPHTLLEDRVFHSHAKGIGIRLLCALGIVEHLHKEQIGHLL